MSPSDVTILGAPSPEEAAAILASVQVLFEAEPASGPELPWAYRSAWRREAIVEGVDRVGPYASSITALRRPMSRPRGGSNDLGGWNVS